MPWKGVKTQPTFVKYLQIPSADIAAGSDKGNNHPAYNWKVCWKFSALLNDAFNKKLIKMLL